MCVFAGGLLFAVNGKPYPGDMKPLQAFMMNFSTGEIIDTFIPLRKVTCCEASLGFIKNAWPVIYFSPFLCVVHTSNFSRKILKLSGK